MTAELKTVEVACAACRKRNQRRFLTEVVAVEIRRIKAYCRDCGKMTIWEPTKPASAR